MVTFVLLSPTFGMHQYTADLERRVRCELGLKTGLITTETLPAGRYDTPTSIVKATCAHGTGFSREALDLAGYSRVWRALSASGRKSTVHFTGVHMWNVPLVYALQRRGTQVIHTLHDLAPHRGVRYAPLIRLWNRLIIASGATILVHGQCYRKQLLDEGLAAARVAHAPLLHGFWGAEAEKRLVRAESETRSEDSLHAKDRPFVIFFGRLEWYKGVDTLLEAWALRKGPATGTGGARLILAGKAARDLALPPMPAGVELRERPIHDGEALELFHRASLLVLPYRDATQSALIGAAARLGVPSLVTRTGALPEYVTPGETGWVVAPEDSGALAAALDDALSDLERLAKIGEASKSWYTRARRCELAALNDLYNE